MTPDLLTRCAEKITALQRSGRIALLADGDEEPIARQVLAIAIEECAKRVEDPIGLGSDTNIHQRLMAKRLRALIPGVQAMKSTNRRSPKGTTMTKSKKSVPPKRPVLVTTAHRGVFFGYAADTDGDTIKLGAARLCVYWSSDCKGFMGLASNGPTKGCRIGPAADIELRDITAVLEVTPDAVKAWESAPWA